MYIFNDMHNHSNCSLGKEAKRQILPTSQMAASDGHWSSLIPFQLPKDKTLVWYGRPGATNTHLLFPFLPQAKNRRLSDVMERKVSRHTFCSRGSSKPLRFSRTMSFIVIIPAPHTESGPAC